MKITNKLMFLFIMLFILTSSIQAQSWKKNLKKLSDIAKDDSSTTEAVSMASSQDALLLQTAVALGSMANAQSFIAMAQGNQELAEQLSNVSKELTGGNISDIKGHVQLIQKTQETQLEVINNKEKMSEDAKKYYQKALAPYFVAAALTVKLKDPTQKFVKDAMNEIKSIRNPLELGKLKKTLSTGLFIGKNIPKLIVSLLKSTKDLMTYSKDNGLDTSKAEKISL